MRKAKLLSSVCVLVAISTGVALMPQRADSQPSPTRPTAQAAPETGTVSAGPFRLRYQIEGGGAPAMVIGSALYYPRVFSQNLRKHLRLAFLDHRGFAASPGQVDVSEFALDKLLDDFERARKQLGLGRVAVIGHSGHAIMAMEYAKKYPANVSHVVMIGMAPDLGPANAAAAARYWDESVWPERKLALDESMRRTPDEQLAALSPGQRFIKNYVRIGPRVWYDPRFDSSPLWDGVDINMEMFNHVWGKIFRDIDITRGLSDLALPVFLALGRYDFLIAPPSAWDPLRPHFRNLTVRIFERSGHTPQYEEPQLFDAELLRWMNENR
jgi:proline iminopeptidase